MPRYIPSPVPRDFLGVRSWIADQLRQISGALTRVNRYPILEAPPEKPEDGMLVYADGVGWNPGGGVGFYGRIAGAWVKL